MKEKRSCEDCGEEYAGDGRYRYCEECRRNRAQRVSAREENCQMCGTDIRSRHVLAKFCLPCSFQRRGMVVRNPPQNDNEKARRITKYAVSVGFLPNPKDFQCVDCGRVQAECYDHRDYNKPLDVDPVCLRCNSSRGRGIPLNAPVEDFVNAGGKKTKAA